MALELELKPPFKVEKKETNVYVLLENLLIVLSGQGNRIELIDITNLQKTEYTSLLSIYYLTMEKESPYIEIMFGKKVKKGISEDIKSELKPNSQLYNILHKYTKFFGIDGTKIISVLETILNSEDIKSELKPNSQLYNILHQHAKNKYALKLYFELLDKIITTLEKQNQEVG